MKKLFLFLTITLVFSCSKNDDSTPTNPIDQLPPITQIGTNRVGCLLNGRVFLPGNTSNSTNCFYQYVEGKYYFYLNFNNIKDGKFQSVSLGTEGLEIQQNQTFNLYERIDGNVFGLYIEDISNSYTDHTYTGKLTITKLTNQIVSGTFFFDVQDENGVVHQIREGRFDMKYTN